MPGRSRAPKGPPGILDRLDRIEPWRIGLGLFAVGFVLRLLFSFVGYPILAEPLGLGDDPDNLGMLAENLVEGDGYRFDFGTQEPSTYRGPLLPFLLAGVILLTGGLFPGAVVALCVIGAIVAPIVYRVGELALGRRAGVMAGALAAVHPFLVWYSPRFRYEVVLATTVAATVLYGVLLIKTLAPRQAVLMGVTAGLSALSAQVSLAIMPFLAITMLWVTPHRKVMLERLALVAATTCVVIAPWTVRNFVVTEGQFIPVQTGGVMEFVRGIYFAEVYSEHPLRVVEVDRAVDERLSDHFADRYRGDRGVDEELAPLAVEFIREHPWQLVENVAANVPRFWYLSESPAKSLFLASIQAPFLIAAAWGAIAMMRRKNRDGLVLVAPVIALNLVYAAFHAKARFSLPVVPMVIVLAVAGMAHLGRGHRIPAPSRSP